MRELPKGAPDGYNLLALTRALQGKSVVWQHNARAVVPAGSLFGVVFAGCAAHAAFPMLQEDFR